MSAIDHIVDQEVGRDRYGQWAPGSSGNPRGYLGTAKNRALAMLDGLFELHAQNLGDVLIEKALNGNMLAMKLILDRVSPVRKVRPINLDWPAINTLGDVDAAMTQLLAATIRGDVDADQARMLSDLLEAKKRTLEAADLERRITLLEASGAPFMSIGDGSDSSLVTSPSDIDSFESEDES